MATMKRLEHMRVEPFGASVTEQMRLCYTFGLRQYTKTIQSHSRVQVFCTPQEQEMLLITCNIFIGYCNLQGDPYQAQAQARTHLTHGLNLVKHDFPAALRRPIL